MSEQQIPSIIINLEDLSNFDTGGAIREVEVRVVVDSSLPMQRQRVNLIHEILGVYLGIIMNREDLEEIAESVNDGLIQWEELTNNRGR